LAKRTLLRFETGQGETRSETLAAIRAALEAAGVEFIAENGGGAGVRLRNRPSSDGGVVPAPSSESAE
jgi:hypothetical protein